MRIKKGDTIQVIAGKDRGKTGKIVRVYPDTMRVLVDGINVFKKRTRPKKQGEKGETVSVPRPLIASNVMLFCGNCKKPTRIGMRAEGESKVRFCKKCQAVLA